MQREAVRVQQPDGSFKVIFRDNPGNQKEQEKKIQKSIPAVQNTRERPRKDKKEIQDPRYFNPLNAYALTAGTTILRMLITVISADPRS